MDLRDTRPLYGRDRLGALRLMLERAALARLTPTQRAAALWTQRIQALAAKELDNERDDPQA